MHYQRIALLIFGVLVLSTSACQTRPEPIQCGEVEKELRVYTLKYFDALEDKGNLRQQLKACQEKK